MIISGYRFFINKKGVSNELVVCNKCGLQTHFELWHYRYWATIFFIPLVPYWVTRAVVCPHCENKIKVKKHNEYDVLSNVTDYLPQSKGGFDIPVTTAQMVEPKPLGVDGQELHRLSQIRAKYARHQGCIAAGGFVSIGVKTNGQIIADGDKKQSRIDGWSNIVMVSAGSFHSVGLRSDGTVVTSGGDKTNLGDIHTWTDIVYISASNDVTVGVKADGSVVAVGYGDAAGCKENDWQDIIAVATSGSHTVGLKSDGTVVCVGKNKYGQCNTNYWSDIVAVGAGGKHTVGLRADGTILATGRITNNMRDILNWQDIAAISVVDENTVGVKSDGTVVYSTDTSLYGLKDVEQWRDIVAVSANSRHIIGLKENGRVVAVGLKRDGCDIDYWRDIGPYARLSLRL